MAFTLFDYAVVLIILVSIVVSVIRGLVKEILSVVGWVTAFILANLYGGTVGEMLPMHGASDGLRLVAGFAIVFILAVFAMALVNVLAGMLVRKIGLAPADRGLGGLFGLARGVLIVVTLVMLGGLTQLPREPFWQNAVLRPLAEAAVETIAPLLPDELVRNLKI
jgi:membrane protein required for colicin V production